MEYDEEAELTRYIWDYYGRLMTEFERRAGRAITMRVKFGVLGAPDDDPVHAQALRERWGIGDPEIDAALADGGEAFRQRVARRLLAECPEQIFINRCPSCGCVVRTPTARQCFWCGHDWHHTSA